MNNINKLLLIIFFLFIAVIMFETGYYLLYPFSTTKKSNSPVQVKRFAKTSLIKLTQEDLAVLNNPYFRNFSPLSYDKEKNRIYSDIPPKLYVEMLKRMGANYAAWISISTYAKDQIDSLIVTSRLKGTISELDVNKTINGKKYLYFKLIGKDNLITEYIYNENFLKTAKFTKMINGTEIPMDWEKELKNNDSIIIEDKSDLTQNPKDPGFTLDAKFIKL